MRPSEISWLTLAKNQKMTSMIFSKEMKLSTRLSIAATLALMLLRSADAAKTQDTSMVLMLMICAPFATAPNLALTPAQDFPVDTFSTLNALSSSSNTDGQPYVSHSASCLALAASKKSRWTRTSLARSLKNSDHSSAWGKRSKKKHSKTLKAKASSETRESQRQATSTTTNLKSSLTIAAPSTCATHAKCPTSVVWSIASKKLTTHSDRHSPRTSCAKIASSRKSAPDKLPAKSMERYKSTGNACTAALLLSSAASVPTTCASLAMMSTTARATHLSRTATASIVLWELPTHLPTKTQSLVVFSLSAVVSADQKRWKCFNRETSIRWSALTTFPRPTSTTHSLLDQQSPRSSDPTSSLTSLTTSMPLNKSKSEETTLLPYLSLTKDPPFVKVNTKPWEEGFALTDAASP